MPEFHDTYYRAVKDCHDHHMRSKTFSGQFLRLHLHQIKELIDQNGYKRVLDYGCGKATAYRSPVPGTDKSIEEYWGAKVTLFDPCYPEHSLRPSDTFDLVLAVQVLCWVPQPALPQVIDDLYHYTVGGIYVAEKIGPVKKQILRDQSLAPRYSAVEWIQALRRPQLDKRHCMFAACYQEPGHLRIELNEVQ